MPRFAYKGIDESGEETFGIVDAENEADALTEVGRKGLFVEEVHRAGISDEWRVRRQQARTEREVRRGKREEMRRKRKSRQRLVVRYFEGAVKYGVCYALNPEDSGFHLDLVDENGITSGETEYIKFSDLKAVFYVKSFDSKYDKSAQYRDWTPEGSELVVEFKDGEKIRGFSLHAYSPDAERFHLIPSDTTTNNISILVEASAVKEVYTPEQYKQKKLAEKEARKNQEVSGDVSQAETMGDFYFETRNYGGALQQYKAAAKEHPQCLRLRKKMLAAEYNVGVQYIKTREYDKALAYMERILKVDPKNSHALKKAHKLRRIIERSPERADAESPSREQ